MTFAEVLPELAAGKKARRSNGVFYRLDGGVLVGMGNTGSYTFRAGDGYLLASDWELVEEPAKPVVDWRGEYEAQHALTEHWKESALRHGATIARLERDLRDVSGAHAAQQEVNHRLERELADVRIREGAGDALIVLLKRDLAEAKGVIASTATALDSMSKALRP